jgi:hypothetical protein
MSDILPWFIAIQSICVLASVFGMLLASIHLREIALRVTALESAQPGLLVRKSDNCPIEAGPPPGTPSERADRFIELLNDPPAGTREGAEEIARGWREDRLRRARLASSSRASASGTP